MLNVGQIPPSSAELRISPSVAQNPALWDASYAMDKPETPLQRFLRMAIESAPKARDFYDKQIQQLSGTTGKPLYDISRGKGLNPRTTMLRHMATALRQPFDLVRRAAEGEEVDPVAVGEDASPPAKAEMRAQTIEDIAAEHGWVLVEEIDLAYGMGGTFIDADRQPDSMGLVPFKEDWLRGIFRGSVQHLKVVRGSGDSMEPTIRNGDIVLIDTSRRRIDEQDVVWAVSYGDIGMIRRLRQLPSGAVQLMPDNQYVRPADAFDGELHIQGKVIFIGRRM